MIEPCYIVSEKSHKKGINWVPVIILELSLKLKAIVFQLTTEKDHIRKLYLLQFEASETSYFQITGANYMENAVKSCPGGFFRGL